MVISFTKHKTIIDLVRWRERMGWTLTSQEEIKNYRDALRQARKEHGISVRDIKKQLWNREEKFYGIVSNPAF